MTGPGIGRYWRNIKVDRPAAGADWELKPGGQRWWRVTSLVAVLTTSAAAGNRTVHFEADAGGDVWAWLIVNAAQVPAVALTYAGHTSIGMAGVLNNTLTIQLPAQGLLLRPGERLRSVTAGIDVADQWSAIVARVEEVPSGLPYLGDELMPPPVIEQEM